MLANPAQSPPLTPRRRARRRLPGGALFLAVLTLPPLIFYLGLSSSNALGMTLVALWLLSRSWPRKAPVQGLRLIGLAKRQRMWVGVIAAIFLHLIAATIFGSIDAFRAAASLLPLTLLLLASGTLANALIRTPAIRLHRGLIRSFLLLCGVALLGATGWGPPTLATAWHSPVFPFSEPSAFALVFIPTLMYASVSTQGATRLGFVLFGLACSALIQNLTLAVGCMLVAAVSLQARALVLLGLPLAIGVAQLDLSYFAARVDFSGEVQNLSNLFYVQGWQMIQESLERSNGFGIGFQQLGVHGTQVAAAELLSKHYGGDEVNVLGSLFVFAKLGSEFGLFGFLLTLAYVVFAVRTIFALRRTTVGHVRVPPLVTLARCVVVAYLIELFVRSAGYFTGTALMLVASLWILRQWHERKE